jgi:hypothetical protein
MILAFKKVRRSGWHGIIDRIQAWYTRGPYVHTEISRGDDEWFSATGAEGVRIKTMKLNHDKWDFVEVPTSPSDTELCWRWCKIHQFKSERAGNMERRGYDFLGVTLSIILPVNIQDNSRYFCNESCHLALQSIGLFMGIRANTLHPNTFHKLITGER